MEGRVPWRIGDLAAATALVFVSFLVIQALAVLTAEVGESAEPDLLTPWILGALEGLMLLAVWAFGVRRYRVPWSSVGLRLPEARSGPTSLSTLWASIIVLPMVALLVSLVSTGVYGSMIDALGLEVLQPTPVPDEFLGSGATRLLLSAVVVLWGPFVEEVFFRGFFLGGLIAPLGAARAALVSAAIFAVAHLEIGSMIPLFITGLVLAWLYLRTRSIWPPLMAHAAQNLLAISLTA